jgi:hypothetical protein
MAKCSICKKKTSLTFNISDGNIKSEFCCADCITILAKQYMKLIRERTKVISKVNKEVADNKRFVESLRTRRRK